MYNFTTVEEIGNFIYIKNEIKRYPFSCWKNSVILNQKMSTKQICFVIENHFQEQHFNLSNYNLSCTIALYF